MHQRKFCFIDGGIVLNNLLSRLRIFLLIHCPPLEYAFVPWKYTYVELLEKTSDVDQVLKHVLSVDRLYYFKVKLGNRILEARAFYEIWKVAEPGDTICVKYRYSRIDGDVSGGRPIDSYIPINLPTKEQITEV